MIKVKGTAKEIARLLADIAPEYPYELISHLDVGRWVFSREGWLAEITITQEAENETADC